MTLRKTFSTLCMVSSLAALGACSYAAEKNHQQVSFVTPNAQDAKCFVFIDKLKYQVLPPQTINITKSENDMVVKCTAPGNRYIEMDVPAKFSNRAIWGSPVGMAWDYASDSIYYYPEVVAIDFSQEALKPNSLPKHNNSDIMQPEEYNLEEFRPSTPRLNSDKNKTATKLLKRGEEYSDSESDAMETDIDDEMGNAVTGGKGNLQPVDGAEDSAGVSANVSEEAVASDAVETTEDLPPVEGDFAQPEFDQVIDNLAEEILETPAGNNQEAVSEPVQIYPGE